MKPVLLKSVKKGDYFTLKPIEEPLDIHVYVRDDYDRASKRYSCHKYSNYNYERFLKGNTIVYIDFYF